MKIYSKGNFVKGVFFVLLAVGSLSAFFIKGASKPFWDVFELVTLSIMCFVLGAYSLHLAFNKEATKKQMIEDDDERATLIKLKSGNSAFSITRWSLLTAMIVAIVAYSITKAEFIIPVIITVGTIFLLMGILQLIVSIFNEKQN